MSTTRLNHPNYLHARVAADREGVQRPGLEGDRGERLRGLVKHGAAVGDRKGDPRYGGGDVEPLAAVVRELEDAAERLRLLFGERATLELRAGAPALVIAEAVVPLPMSRA